MNSFRNFLFRLTHSTPERKATRDQLKRAKAGDSEAYLVLASHYLDLSLVYFGGCLHEDRVLRYARAEQVFAALWKLLPYAERVSDFEFMLANALIENAPESGTILSEEALVTKLRLLDPKYRFAFIAYEFENWSLRWVALLMRVRPSAIHQLLSEARCELCGVSWDSLSDEERECLEAISVSMDKCPNVRANKALSQKVSQFPRVAEIKAQWLELRPELVEVRHRYLPEQAKREELMANILKSTESSKMSQPPLVDRVVNSVHFTRHAKINVS